YFLAFFAVANIPINHWAGYRTPASMRAEKSWRLANHYMGKVSIILTLLYLLFYFLLTQLHIGATTSDNWLLGYIVIPFICIGLTELKLRKNNSA
ncbi:SdpI family protein, partial [Loigolactobacillus coryniformis subsp. coryniformis]|uniref:SdpI family protein n=1 Tax=Loigolactobacillus coryniformis TaxID=1610 RepID=UPI0039945203